jgi:hypothetical protein
MFFGICRLSRAAMRKAMFGAHIQANEPLHWICYVDASRVRIDEPGNEYNFHQFRVLS